MAAGARSFGAEDDRAIHIGNRRIGFSAAATPDAVPWGDLGCDIVLECTGKFLKPDAAGGILRPRREAVIVAAPVKDGSCAQRRRRRQRSISTSRRGIGC